MRIDLEAHPRRHQYPAATGPEVFTSIFDCPGAITKLRGSGGVIFTVPQNIVEFWSVATRPVAANGLGYSPILADRLIRRLQRVLPLIPDNALIHEEWRKLVVSNGIIGRQSHDARFVAAMIVHGISDILTFNLADFRRYGGINAIDPAAVASGP